MRRFFAASGVFSMSLLFISLFLSVRLFVQPPIATNTLYVGNGVWGPSMADPVHAYDSLSNELISNVYDTLISMSYDVYWNFVPRLATNVPTRESILKSVSSSDVNLTSPTGSNWSDGSYCIGWVDNNSTGGLDASDVLYLVEMDGSYRTWRVQTLQAGFPVIIDLWRGRYTFHIRTDPTISFYNETGSIVDAFNVSDAEYSFKRGLVQDQSDGPMWMFYEPLFSQQDSDPFDSNTTEPTAISLAHLIDNAVEVNGTDLILNVGTYCPDNTFKETLSQTWSSIVSKEFSISIGCWNGDLFTDTNGDNYPDWWTIARRIPESAYDTPGNYRYVGTGPFHVSLFDSLNGKVILERNIRYWGGWPGPACGTSFAEGYLDTVDIYYISDWNIRKAEFMNGTLDICRVLTLRTPELLSNITKEPVQPEMKTIKNLLSLSVSAASFTFTINPTSPWLGTMHFPDGIPTDFFNNTHTRKAFAYAINHTQFITQALLGEATWSETPLIKGLFPDYHTTVKGYDANYSASEAELKQAMYNGVSVWDTGFTLTLPVYAGHDLERIAWQGIKDFFGNLSIYDGRTGAPFQINIVQNQFPLMLIDPRDYPMWIYSWLADYADADNFVRPYMHSSGYFAYLQNYTANNGWSNRKDRLIDEAINIVDGSQRAALYADLEQIYIDDCPSIPLAQPLTRMWMKYWVKGWYYNPFSNSPVSGYCYYSLWKCDDCWYDSSGPMPGVSDGATNMRDIAYLIAHFNAKAPIPSQPPDPRWVGVYGANGCVDPEGNRICSMRSIAGAIQHFNHRYNTVTP